MASHSAHVRMVLHHRHVHHARFEVLQSLLFDSPRLDGQLRAALSAVLSVPNRGAWNHVRQVRNMTKPQRCQYQVLADTDALSGEYFPGEPPNCTNEATHISCQPLIDTPTCEAHKCRCAKRIERKKGRA